MSKTYKYVGKRFIDLSYVCQQLEDGCKVCKTGISLAHYEDDYDRPCLHITFNLFTSQFYCMIHVVSFKKTTLISATGTHEEIIKSLKSTSCIISIGENTLSVKYSDIYHVLSNLCP